MHVWYESQHRHKSILEVFGEVLGAFGGVWLERLEAAWNFRMRLERFRSVWERLAG